jgi:hypothetical protein
MIMAALRLFISHAQADTVFAQRLSDNLRQLGADAWLDASHMGSGDFVGHINAALQNCDVVILVLTPMALASKWVHLEVDAAIARERAQLMKPMIVVMAEPTSIESIPPLWNIYHRYDATHDYAGALYGVATELSLTIPTPQHPIKVLPANTTKNRSQYSWLFRLSIAGLLAMLLPFLAAVTPTKSVFDALFNFLFLHSTFINGLLSIFFGLGVTLSSISIAWSLFISYQRRLYWWIGIILTLLLLLAIVILIIMHANEGLDNQPAFVILIAISVAANAALPSIFSLARLSAIPISR